MDNIQDPKKQIDYLQQCLSSNKIPLGLFLGAGCPMAVRVGANGEFPLIPDIAGITKFVQSEIAKDPLCNTHLKIIEGHFTKDERNEPTIEDILTHIRALRAVAGKDEVRGLSAINLDSLDDKICQVIQGVADKALPNNQTPYHRIAKWVDATRRDNPIEIFTTNYDLLMEQAFEDSCVPYFDGFAGVRKPFFDLRAMEEDMLPPRWARLWKLHGSVNWYQVADKGVFRGTTVNEGGAKRVIHPSHLKYQESRRMPYLAMIDRLRAFLKIPTLTLIMSGYSFRDEHINEVIVQGLKSMPTAIAFALIFDEIEKYPQAISLASQCPNLSILARNGAIISGQKSVWPEYNAESVSPENDVWINLTVADQNGKRKAEFALGDFATFGNFLKELTGDFRKTNEVSDV